MRARRLSTIASTNPFYTGLLLPDLARQSTSRDAYGLGNLFSRTATHRQLPPQCDALGRADATVAVLEYLLTKEDVELAAFARKFWEREAARTERLVEAAEAEARAQSMLAPTAAIEARASASWTFVRARTTALPAQVKNFDVLDAGFDASPGDDDLSLGAMSDDDEWAAASRGEGLAAAGLGSQSVVGDVFAGTDDVLRSDDAPRRRACVLDCDDVFGDAAAAPPSRLKRGHAAAVASSTHELVSQPAARRRCAVAASEPDPRLAHLRRASAVCDAASEAVKLLPVGERTEQSLVSRDALAMLSRGEAADLLLTVTSLFEAKNVAELAYADPPPMDIDHDVASGHALGTLSAYVELWGSNPCSNDALAYVRDLIHASDARDPFYVRED